MDAIEINNLIADYFDVGLQQNEIVAMLAMKHILSLVLFCSKGFREGLDLGD